MSALRISGLDLEYHHGTSWLLLEKKTRTSWQEPPGHPVHPACNFEEKGRFKPGFSYFLYPFEISGAF